MAILFYTLKQPSGNEWFFSFPHFDKVAHFGVFFILAILSQRVLVTFQTVKATTFSIIAAYGLILGAAIEYLQLGIAGRSGDIFDLIADMLGLFAGLFIIDLVKIP